MSRRYEPVSELASPLLTMSRKLSDVAARMKYHVFGLLHKPNRMIQSTDDIGYNRSVRLVNCRSFCNLTNE